MDMPRLCFSYKRLQEGPSAGIVVPAVSVYFPRIEAVAAKSASPFALAAFKLFIESFRWTWAAKPRTSE